MHTRNIVGVVRFAVTLATLASAATLGGCNNHQKLCFGPRDLRNDGRHCATLVTDLVLVPGVPFETRQNAILRRADSSGRDFFMLVGPYPANGPAAVITAKNPDVITVQICGFAMIWGAQPSAVANTTKSSSGGTHYITWISPTGTYTFVEHSTGSPVHVEPVSGSGFKPEDLTTGQYAFVPSGGGPVVKGTYFPAKDPHTFDPKFSPDLIDVVTYVRSRAVAAGFLHHDEFNEGIYKDGIPATH